MKHLKFYESFEKSIDDIASEVDSILVELVDDGFEINIFPSTSKPRTYLYITISEEGECFWFNSKIYNRLLFLNDYLKEKYKNITIKVNDDFMEPTEFPCSIEEFSDEITVVEIQIYI